MIDDDVLGKAYDARLMRRLLEYLRPHRRYAALALAAIICASMLQLAQPYLMKLAIDSIHRERRSAGRQPDCAAVPAHHPRRRSAWSSRRRGCCR